MDREAVGSRRPRIVLFGLFGSSNLGNDATLSVTLHHLRARAPSAELICVCGNPGAVERAHGVPSLPLDPLPPWTFWRVPNRALREACVAIATIVTEPIRGARIRRLVQGADQFIVVGTGVLDDFGERPWAMPAWLYRWCRHAKRAGAVVRFLAVGAGPIDNRANRFLMMRAVRLSDDRSYRDSVSKDFLQGLGIDTARDPVVPDLVFGLPTEMLARYRAPVAPPRTIGIGVMGYFGWSNDREKGRATYEAYLAKMSRFVLGVLHRGYTVRLLLGQLNADERPVRDLLDAVIAQADSQAAARLSAPKIETLHDLMGAIAETDAVVATRYHNVICALVLGRPVIAVGYASKFDALMREVGLDAYCQPIDQLSVDKLDEQFEELMANHEQLAAQVMESAAALRDRLGHLYDSLFGVEAACALAPRELPR